MDDGPYTLVELRKWVIQAVSQCTDETLLDLVWKLLVHK